MSFYTVLLTYPEYADQQDNGYSGTYQTHIEADSPEDAIDLACHMCAADCGREINDDNCLMSDFGFVGVYAGCLENLYAP